MTINTDIDGAGGKQDGEIVPFVMGICLVAVFAAGLMLASHAVDDYSYGSGLAFSAFGLFLAARYFNRFLPS